MVSILNYNIRNISISLIVTEIIPVLTVLRHNPNKKIKNLSNIVRISIHLFYRIPYAFNVLFKSNQIVLKTACLSFLSIDFYWIFLSLKSYL